MLTAIEQTRQPMRGKRVIFRARTRYLISQSSRPDIIRRKIILKEKKYTDISEATMRYYSTTRSV